MNNYKLFFIPLLAFSLGSASIGHAQTPQERAVKIKEWRANCGDPDPDLRVAYVEAAIASEDQTIIRTCLKETLVSDNPDVQNMALRAALSSVDRLTVVWEMPAAYKTEIQKADGDNDKITHINRRYRDWIERTEDTNGQMGLVPMRVDFSSNTSKWGTLWANAKSDDSYFVDIEITGTTLQAIGVFNYAGSSKTSVNFTLELNDSGVLSGTGSLHDDSDFVVRALLF